MTTRNRHIAQFGRLSNPSALRHATRVAHKPKDHQLDTPRRNRNPKADDWAYAKPANLVEDFPPNWARHTKEK